MFNIKASTDNIYDAVAARYGQRGGTPQRGGTFGLMRNCAELAGHVTIPKMIRGTVREYIIKSFTAIQKSHAL